MDRGVGIMKAVHVGGLLRLGAQLVAQGDGHCVPALELEHWAGVQRVAADRGAVVYAGPELGARVGVIIEELVDVHRGAQSPVRACQCGHRVQSRGQRSLHDGGSREEHGSSGVNHL